MSFMLLPPEVNSTLMYTGGGSGPLIAAAAAWDGLAADLASTATSVHGVISGLDGSWQGVGAAAATSSVAPYVAWLEQASANAAQMGAQAKAAAALFETAHAATVPPPVIAANRAMLMALISTNFFGQNTPAIAATEAHYETMWAQDGAAMDSYAAASETNNNALQKQAPPPQVAHSAAAEGGPTTTPPVTDGGTGTGTGGYNFATIGGWLDALHVPTAGIDPQLLASPISGISGLSSVSSFAMMPIRFLMMIPQLARAFGMMGGSMGTLAGQTAGAASGTGTLMTQIGEFVNEKLQGAVGVLAGHFSTATNAISAKLGQAASMGALKVPQAWSMAADGMVRAAPVLPATTVSAPIQTMSATSGMPGGPFGNAMLGAMAGRGMGAIAAKAPKVMPRSPAGG